MLSRTKVFQVFCQKIKKVIFLSFGQSCWNRIFKRALARHALFRGRLRAFGKCTDGGASSKGRQNFDSVRRAAHGLRKTVLHTCSDLFKPVQTSSHLFTPVHTCSKLFKHFHTCSHLFTTAHTPETTLFAQLQFLVQSSPWKICYFSILDLCLVK